MEKNSKTWVEIIPRGHVDETFLTQVDMWTRGLIEGADDNKAPSRISLILWEKTRDFEEFDAREKAEMGISTGGESEFLASHEAWRGFPRIHFFLEKIENLSEEIIQGVVQHEVGHALLHGNPEFYRFRFSTHLQEIGRRAGLDLPILQQLVYLLSVAVKDEEVLRFLTGRGLGFYQSRLLEYLLGDTREEQQTWTLIRDHPPLRLLASAVFLKILLPIETLAHSGAPDAGPLLEKWEEVYSWLPEQKRKDLRAFARFVIGLPFTTFQNRLEKAVLELIGRAFRG
jgi:hypothetical protein